MLLFSLLYCWLYWYGSTAGYINCVELRAQNSKTVDGESSVERPLGEEIEPSSAGGVLLLWVSFESPVWPCAR